MYFLSRVGLQLGKLFHFIIYNIPYLFHLLQETEQYDQIADAAAHKYHNCLVND